MATIQQIKERIDLHDLADRLGLKRGKGKGSNYHSPHHDDTTPSLSIYNDKHTGETKWKDFSNPGAGGSCIDLVMYCQRVETGEAVKLLHEWYQIPFDKPAPDQTQPQSKIEYLASQCKGNEQQIKAYLCGRGISDAAVEHAIKQGTLGFNTWCSDQVPAGVVGHHGPAVAFIVKTLNPGHVVAVDKRFLNPELNGGVKTQSSGKKSGYVWTADIKKLKRAHTVYAVESAINALSVDSCDMRGTAAFALRGTGNVDTVDFHFLNGKRVVICLDNDKPTHEGKYPGQEASWALYERLTAMNVSCHIVDQEDWTEPGFNDVNDIIQAEKPAGLKTRLAKFSPWIIPGVSGAEGYEGPRRIFLPSHDFSSYWRYRAKEDFTTYIKKRDTDSDGNVSLEFQDLCGFRVASVSRVTIAGSMATMTGEEDTQPSTKFAVSVQTPRHGNRLIRRVFEDERLHNVDMWGKFGPVYSPKGFLRMINIMERGAHLGARDAINFVGLAWQQGKPVVNEGPDCYFTDPDKQCPYHNLTFPSGTESDARKVIEAYQATFSHNAAMQLLAWSLGGHLKAFLGFWPHMVMQADKGSGKSTLIKALERSIAFTMFSGQSLQTEFRLLTSISYTSHPVGWEEVSARAQLVIDKMVSLLQEGYQHTVTRRGTDMTEYIVAAPVLLAGEDVPVKSLTGKLVRVTLSRRKGAPIPDGLPRFPVRQWLQFLTKQNRSAVKELHQKALEHCKRFGRSAGYDEGASRMLVNYAAVLTAWRLLTEFAGIDKNQGEFIPDLMQEMNTHIQETSLDREPWVWIIETLFSEISSGAYRYPFAFRSITGEGEPVNCLVIRTQHIMHHLKHSMHLRDTYNSLPVKSDRVLKRQLEQADIVFKDRVDITIGTKREGHMVALALPELERYGLHISRPETLDHMDGSACA